MGDVLVLCRGYLCRVFSRMGSRRVFFIFYFVMLGFMLFVSFGFFIAVWVSFGLNSFGRFCEKRFFYIFLFLGLGELRFIYGFWAVFSGDFL